MDNIFHPFGIPSSPTKQAIAFASGAEEGEERRISRRGDAASARRRSWSQGRGKGGEDGAAPHRASCYQESLAATAAKKKEAADELWLPRHCRWAGHLRHPVRGSSFPHKPLLGRRDPPKRRKAQPPLLPSVLSRARLPSSPLSSQPRA